MTEIKNYAIRYHGGPSGSAGNVRAQLHLFDAGHRLLGWIDFYDQPQHIPPDQEKPHIVISMPIYMLEPILHTIRNESPVYLVWYSKMGRGSLITNREPVGEGEAQSKA